MLNRLLYLILEIVDLVRQLLVLLLVLTDLRDVLLDAVFLRRCPHVRHLRSVCHGRACRLSSLGSSSSSG